MEQTVNAPRLADLKIDFAVIMPDDSMKNKGIWPGDVVYLEACDHVDNGQTAAVQVGKDVFVRVIWQEETWLSLVPENPAYISTVLQGAEMDRAELLGKVVAFTHIYPDKHPGGVKTTPAPNDRGVSE